MKYSVLLFGALITILGFYVENSSQRLPIRCPLPRILNGRVRQRPNGRALRFNCISGYTLVGSRTATCSRGRWNTALPVCVKAQCTPITKLTNTLVIPVYNGAVLMFFCDPGYERQGPSEIYCDGKTWNDTAPNCTRITKANPPKSCSFENLDLCSWEQDPSHDFDWTIHNFNTPSWHIATGPSHDHTLGPGGSGYYLYIEADDKLENNTARIMSPLYRSNLTEAGCFSFWYHMYGETIGTLNVYFKPEGEANRTLMFTKSGNQGNHWWQGYFHLPKENNSFQLIVEGVRGTGYRSDIAIDDVAILQGNECIPNLSTTPEIISTDGYDQVEIVNGMQTCLGRCTYSNTTENSTSLCQCDLYCSENQNCCPDYAAYCILANDTIDSSTDSSEITTVALVETKLLSTRSDRVPIPVNPRDDIDPYPPKISNKTSGQVSTTTTTPRVRPTISIKTTKVPTKIPPRNRITTSTATTVLKITTTENKFDNQIDTHVLTAPAQSTSSRDPSKVTLPGIIAIVVGAIVGIAVMGLIVIWILQKRNNYKNSSGKSALSDDSDVRFLTSDEMLDFNLAKPEDMEM